MIIIARPEWIEFNEYTETGDATIKMKKPNACPKCKKPMSKCKCK